MKFKKTMRERYPRKTKKVILKYVTRSAYSEAMHFEERFRICFDVAVGIDRTVTCIGSLPVELAGELMEAQANHYKRFYSTPCAEADAIVAELKESAKSQPKNMTKEEEITYMIGDTGISESLIESINQMNKV